MSSVAVFVFLLDNITGFNNALNDTLIQAARYAHCNETPVIQNCDPFPTDQILSTVGNNLDMIFVPASTNDDNHPNNEQLKDQSPEIFNTDFDFHEADNFKDISLEKSFNAVEYDFSSLYSKSIVDTEHEKVKNSTKIEFPKSAPFLVAIFETLSNITAQTCAGTLLTPRWVLTAANCVNILSSLYTNSTNMTHSSHYTVVAESTNPLLDGTAHNVTKVLLHPNSSRSADMEESYMALMRIEPEVEVPVMELMEEGVTSGDVMVYGWMMSKNESDHTTMNRTAAASQIVSSAECQAMYSYKDNDVLCLVSYDMEQNIAQLSSGGPVLVIHDNKVKMLAVVQTDEHVFVSYPLAPHYSWIRNTIANK